MNRIIIIGATGTGKTTLAFQLAAKMDIPVTDLDDLHWRPGWVEAPRDEFRTAVDQATSGNQWILAGNYAAQKDISWPRADTLVWLDYSLARTFAQLPAAQRNASSNRTKFATATAKACANFSQKKISFCGYSGPTAKCNVNMVLCLIIRNSIRRSKP